MSVMTFQNVSRKRHGLFVLALLLFLLGGVGIYFGSHNYLVRALGVVSVMAGAYLARISDVRDRSSAPRRAVSGLDLKTADGPSRFLWVISLAMVPLLVIALFLLHIDAVSGGHEAWPADIFAGIGFACAIVWGYLVMKILRR
jgi:hypothetical protein